MSPSVILVSLALGVAFGAILQRVQASSPDRIIGTLTLRDLTILKFMLLAIGVGAIGIGGLAALGLAHLKVKALTLVAVAVGGLVFGAGFAIGGYCPGTCLVGAAEGRKDALFTIVGGLAGALVFALVYPALKPVLIEPLSLGSPTLAELSGLGKGLAGMLFGALMVVLAFVLPTHPGRSERAVPGGEPVQAA
ncbi:YeeE/YedE thiosulfate transporter family protein [Anaeromyxobacter sp. Fw109-5]|uniref:YeeE/YedE thiosulfate transporter family protein n=1 Tax=Anaeromyxobacter sp. (strain Fw109-5) TaxID=404589 RepID=UPI0000ED8B4D|nr:YeeE/YedE thiosulfate transporter family protein [Anaeromyxobacter sp. Fw109-5]ABS27529.1 conserved hypothetical protein [Anaeromyxobacter sp. Fw109-5]